MSLILELFDKNKEGILKFSGKAVDEFLLKNASNFDKESLNFIANQLLSKQKAKQKLPHWHDAQNIIFPPPLSVEQASSELTAQYKAHLVSGNLADITGGMGIDSSYFASACDAVIYVERNAELVAVAKHNFQEFGLKNITTFEADGVKFLEESTSVFDWIYLDPARRDAAKNKVFLLSDCEPNVLIINDLLLNKARKVLLKTSPLLDIQLAINQLIMVSEVHILAVENEVKELLFVVEKQENASLKICAVNLKKHEKQSFEFCWEDEKKAQNSFSKPQKYIYEPNAAILKAGAFKSVANQNNLNKIAVNSHLYSSEILVDNFAGRAFECLKICRLDKKMVQDFIRTDKANVSVRNFPLSAEDVKKKLGLKDGGEFYIFATEDSEKQKIVLICRKVY